MLCLCFQHNYNNYNFCSYGFLCSATLFVNEIRRNLFNKNDKKKSLNTTSVPFPNSEPNGILKVSLNMPSYQIQNTWLLQRNALYLVGREKIIIKT